jgi:uncharacterized protein YjbI with pentapeptide repeats
MSEQKEMSQQSILRQIFRVLLGHKIGNTKVQTHPQPDLPQPPRPEDFENWAEYTQSGWPTYWNQVGQPWRYEPVIDEKRQEILKECRAKRLGLYVYPFSEIEPKLTRADIEWLLATHENGRGPVDWRDFYQWDREGLDLQGVDLHQVNLQMLPLSRMRGSETIFIGNRQQFERTRIHLEETGLKEAHLEGAYIWGAHLEKADLRSAHLEDAHLDEAHLEEARLNDAHLEGTNLKDAYLEGANLRGAFFDATTDLKNVTLGNEKVGFASLADVHWGDVNLSVIDWTQVKVLGDERAARQAKKHEGKERIKKTGLDKYRETRLDKFKVAVRANRQLSVVLRDQGLNEEADHFAYHAQKLQRAVWRQQHRYLKYVGSCLLWLLAGYGYRPLRSLIAYLVIIFGFMGLYLLNAHFVAPHLRWDEALVLSVSSFHGRGFFTQNVTLGDTYARLAAIEAIVGLFIEISFIATFTQRFFGK